jgi:sugar/nucleoside kinase (ribokinase family)
MRILPREAREVDVVGFGEASIDEVWRLPKGLGLGGKGRALARDRLGGGQIATALCAASRLGARAQYLGPIGDDAIGDEIARGLIEDGVTLAEQSRIAGARSRLALIVVEHGGERTVVEDGGADAPIGDAAQAAVRAARSLHVDATRPAAAVALGRIARV